MPETGFPPPGLIGLPSGGCVANGPFRDFKTTLDPGPLPPDGIVTASGPRCLRRNFQPDATDASLSWKANVVPLLNITNFPEFTAGFDADVGKTGKFSNGVHGGGHFGVGGEVSKLLALAVRYLPFAELNVNCL